MPTIEPMRSVSMTQPIDCCIATMAVRVKDEKTITIDDEYGYHTAFEVKGGIQATMRWAQIERAIMVLEKRGIAGDDIVRLAIDLLCSTTDHVFRDLGSLVDLLEKLYKDGA